jgi:lysophospholipase L1-like esterase
VTYSRYVALGDSFTEGCGDDAPDRPNGVRGWADRFAAEYARLNPGFEYANLAIRGRKIRQALAEQIEPAIAMKPDLVSIYLGGNDVLRPSVDIDGLMVEYDAAIGRLTDSGAQVVMFTPFDPGVVKLFAATRGRFAIYAEFAREIADRHGAVIVDVWRRRAENHPSMWADDRLHMSSIGHQTMAVWVLDALGIEHGLTEPERVDPAHRTASEIRRDHLVWTAEHLGPWIHRRLTGRSSGDGIAPRWPVMMPPIP